MKFTKKHLLYILLLIGWSLALFGHFFWVPNTNSPLEVAFADPFTHGIIGVMITLPFFIKGYLSTKDFIIISSFSVFIDIDHGFAAGSFDVADWVKLTERPLTHSLAFSLLIGLVYSLIKSRKIFTPYFLVTFLCLASHVMRDGTDPGKTPWNFPFEFIQIKTIFYFLIFIILSFGLTFLSEQDNNIENQT